MATGVTKGPSLWRYNTVTKSWINYGESWELVWSKPSTESRIKPADPFRYSTNRSRSYTLSTYYLCDWAKTGPEAIYRKGGADCKAAMKQVDTTAELNLLITRLRSAIRSQASNLALSSAEYKKTASTFSELGTSVVNAFRSLRRQPVKAIKQLLNETYAQESDNFYRHRRGLPKRRNSYRFTSEGSRRRHTLSKAVSSRWLSIQFGLLPTISDFHGAVDQMTKNMQAGVFQYATEQTRKVTSVLNTDPSVNQGHAHVSVAKQTYSLRGRARYVVSCTGLKTLTEIGFTNPAALAWELLPYSWLIDYLINVGDVLNSMDALVGVSDIKCIYTSRKTEVRSYATGYRLSGNSDRLTYSLNRNANLILSPPKLAFKDTLSKTKIVNTLAALRLLKS